MSYPTQADNFKQQYINNLNLQIANNDLVYNAVKMKDLKPVLPIRPPDNQTLEEKQNDLQGMLNSLRENLIGLTDGVNLNQILDDIKNNIELLRFVTQMMPSIIEFIKKNYKIGINYTAFISYIEQQYDKNNNIIVAIQPLLQAQASQQTLLNNQLVLQQQQATLQMRQQQYLDAQEQSRLQLIADEKKRLIEKEIKREQDALEEELRLQAEEQRKIDEARNIVYQQSLQIPTYEAMDIEPSKQERAVKPISFILKKSIKTLRKEEAIQQEIEREIKINEMAEQVMIEIDNDLNNELEKLIQFQKENEIEKRTSFSNLKDDLKKRRSSNKFILEKERTEDSIKQYNDNLIQIKKDTKKINEEQVSFNKKKKLYDKMIEDVNNKRNVNRNNFNKKLVENKQRIENARQVQYELNVNDLANLAVSGIDPLLDTYVQELIDEEVKQKQEAERIRVAEIERLKQEAETRRQEILAIEDERIKFNNERTKVVAESYKRMGEKLYSTTQTKTALQNAEYLKEYQIEKERIRIIREHEIETARLQELKRLAEIEMERLRLEEIERQRLAEIERLRLAEIERQRLAEIERLRLEEIERQRLAEIERLRLLELDRIEEERINREKQAKILEEKNETKRKAMIKVEEIRLRRQQEKRDKEEALERARLAEIERLRLEEIEQLRLVEIERLRVIEVERLRLVEIERQRLAEIERLRLLELNRQEVLAGRNFKRMGEKLYTTQQGKIAVQNAEYLKEYQIEKQRLAEIERQRLAEIERLRLEKIERQRLAEIERQRVAEIERQRVAEIERQKAELIRQHQIETARLLELKRKAIEEQKIYTGEQFRRMGEELQTNARGRVALQNAKYLKEYQIERQKVAEIERQKVAEIEKQQNEEAKIQKILQDRQDAITAERKIKDDKYKADVAQRLSYAEAYKKRSEDHKKRLEEATTRRTADLKKTDEEKVIDIELELKAKNKAESIAQADLKKTDEEKVIDIELELKAKNKAESIAQAEAYKKRSEEEARRIANLNKKPVFIDQQVDELKNIYRNLTITRDKLDTTDDIEVKIEKLNAEGAILSTEEDDTQYQINRKYRDFLQSIVDDRKKTGFYQNEETIFHIRNFSGVNSFKAFMKNNNINIGPEIDKITASNFKEKKIELIPFLIDRVIKGYYAPRPQVYILDTTQRKK